MYYTEILEIPRAFDIFNHTLSWVRQSYGVVPYIAQRAASWDSVMVMYLGAKFQYDLALKEKLGDG